MTQKPWSRGELAVLRRLYRRVPTAELAERLGRSRRAIYQSAASHGLARPAPKLTRSRVLAVRRMHAAGHPDGDIGRRLRIDRRTVCVWRRRLSLPSNAHSERVRRRIARKTRGQLRKAGCRSLAELKRSAIAARARRLGWPEDLRWRSVQILETLWLIGPQTRRQLAVQIGMRRMGSRVLLASNDPEGNYLAHLMARGLVVRLGRCVYNGGPGKNTFLYGLPIDVAPSRQDSACAVPEVWVPESLRSEADSASAERSQI